MGGDAIDLSGGLVPKTPAAPPSGGVDLSGGLVPKTAAPTASGAPPTVAPTPMTRDDAINAGLTTGASMVPGGDQILGGVKSATEGVIGLDNMIRHGLNKVLPNRQPTLTDVITGKTQPQGHYEDVNEADFGLPKGFTERTTPEENAGAFGETVLEFMLGDEALKGMSIAEKMGKVAPALKVLERNPRLMKAVYTAIRQGTVSAAQTGAHGGTPQEMLENAILTGGTGATIEGGTALVKGAVNRVAPTVEKIGSVEHPVPAEARNAKPTATQAAGQKVYRETAQEAARPAMEEIEAARHSTTPEEVRAQNNGSGQGNGDSVEAQNRVASEKKAGIKRVRIDTRSGQETPIINNVDAVDLKAQPHERIVKRFPDGHEEVLDEGAKARPTPRTVTEDIKAQNARREAGSMASTVPERTMPKPGNPVSDIGSTAATVPDSVLGPKTGVTEEAPEAAKNTLNEMRATGARESVAQHLDRVHDFTSAADLIDEHAHEIYGRADELSEGKFKAANNELRAAQKARWNANTEDAQQAAEQRLFKARQDMESTIDGLKGKVSPDEINAARTAMRRTYALREVGNTLDSSWSGLPGSSARGNAYRGFDGNRLMSGLQRLQKQMGRSQLEALLGKNRVENLERIAELNRTGANRQKFGAAVDHVAKWIQNNGTRHVSWPVVGGALGEMSGIGWAKGATAGEAAFMATRQVMRAVEANPRIGQFLTYAIDSGARPEYYGPMLGAMIVSSNSNNSEDNSNEQ